MKMSVVHFVFSKHGHPLGGPTGFLGGESPSQPASEGRLECETNTPSELVEVRVSMTSDISMRVQEYPE